MPKPRQNSHLRRTSARYKPAALAKPQKDPDLHAIADRISRMTASQIRDRSWISYSAARAILTGKTSRPQNLTIAGLLYAAGYTRVIKKL